MLLSGSTSYDRSASASGSGPSSTSTGAANEDATLLLTTSNVRCWGKRIDSGPFLTLAQAQMTRLKRSVKTVHRVPESLHRKVPYWG
jgi:hypothetical protein